MGFLRRLFGGKANRDEQLDEWLTAVKAAGIDTEAKVKVVRAYLVTVDPSFVIGIENNNEWYLPGGIVEGPGRPDGGPPGQHFAPLAWHLKEQTGLTLEGLSDAIGVGMFPGNDGIETTVLYAGRASGTQTGGSRFALDEIPEFASVCNVSEQEIRDICSRI